MRIEPWKAGIAAFVFMFLISVAIASLSPQRAYEAPRLSEMESATLAFTLDQEAEKIINRRIISVKVNNVRVEITSIHDHTHLTVFGSEGSRQHNHFRTIVINDVDPTLSQLIDATDEAAEDVAEQISL